jgi:hypothetical protein
LVVETAVHAELATTRLDVEKGPPKPKVCLIDQVLLQDRIRLDGGNTRRAAGAACRA